MKLDNSNESFNGLIKIFSYNKNLPIDIQENRVKQKNNVLVHDISYSGVKKQINAYLVNSVENPLAGIIFVHPAPGNRSTFK